MGACTAFPATSAVLPEQGGGKGATCEGRGYTGRVELTNSLGEIPGCKEFCSLIGLLGTCTRVVKLNAPQSRPSGAPGATREILRWGIRIMVYL